MCGTASCLLKFELLPCILGFSVDVSRAGYVGLEYEAAGGRSLK